METFLKSNLNLQHYTSIHIGGTVEWAFFPVEKDSLPEIFSIIQDKLKVPFFILGKGSNVIIQDKELHMAAILTHKLSKHEFQEDLLIVEAGAAMTAVAKTAILDHSLTGLEFVYGLPGSIGGGVYMNARVYGSEFSDIVEWVEVYDYKKKEFLTISAKDCDFGYKTTIFQTHPYCIYRTGLRLKKTSDAQACWEKARNYVQMRIEKQHFKYPSAGSFFKNDYSLGAPSGKILDELGLRGFSKGGAKIADFHANFFINTGSATFQDMKDLCRSVLDILKEKKGIALEPEAQFISEEEGYREF